jgi:hypothetical protein
MTHKHMIIAATSLSLLIMPAPAGAADAVVTVNGIQVEHVLSQLTFEGDNVILHFADGAPDQSEDMATVTITMSATTDISRLKTFTTARPVGNELTLDGIAAGDRVTIYDMGGRMCMQTTSSGGSMRLSLKGLKAGVYIVKAGNNIIKLQKK